MACRIAPSHAKYAYNYVPRVDDIVQDLIAFMASLFLLKEIKSRLGILDIEELHKVFFLGAHLKYKYTISDIKHYSFCLYNLLKALTFLLHLRLVLRPLHKIGPWYNRFCLKSSIFGLGTYTSDKERLIQ